MEIIFLFVLALYLCFLLTYKKENKHEKNLAKIEVSMFLIWFTENHFKLYDIRNGKHLFRSDSFNNVDYDLEQLIELFKKEQ